MDYYLFAFWIFLYDCIEIWIVFVVAEDIGFQPERSSSVLDAFKRRQLLGFIAVSFRQNSLDF